MRKARNILDFERYSPVIFQIVMCGEVDNIIAVIFRAKINKNITVEKSPWYCGRDHSAFVHRISVDTRTCIH